MNGNKIGYLLPIATLAALLAVSAVVWAQSSANFNLRWHTINNGGEKSSSANYQVNGTIGQMDVGAHSSSNYKLSGGFRQNFPPKPQAVTDLSITNDAGSAKLTWTAITMDVAGNALSNVTYNIYRDIGNPYFTPGAPYASGLTSSSYTDPDTAVLNDPNHNAFYIVTAVSAGGESLDSNRVGTFNFALVPGSP